MNNGLTERPVPTTEWLIEQMQDLFRRHQTNCQYADEGRTCDIDFIFFHALARLKTLRAVEKRAVTDDEIDDEVASLLQGMVLVQAALTAKEEGVVEVPEYERPKDVACPTCLAAPGAPCMKWPSYNGPMKDFHVTRWDKSKESQT